MTDYGITPERAMRLARVLSQRQPSLTIVFENVHDPHNVGAVIRTCDAVGIVEVHGVYNGKQSFPKLGSKSAASARKWVDVVHHNNITDCYAALRARGFRILTTHIGSDSVSLFNIDLTNPVALVFGNEHDGVSDEARAHADGNFLIPQVGVVQSLNISVACAVALYEAFRQRMQSGMYAESQFTQEELEQRKQDWYSR